MTQSAEAARYERLEGFLASDPDNLRLLADTADAAFQAARIEDTVRLIDRYAAITPPPPPLINLLGLSALADARYEDASRIFEVLLRDAPGDPGLCFNLAWARDRLGNHEGVLDALGAETATPQGATLRVRSLHHLQRLDEALALGDAWDGRSDDPNLWAALATVALDADDLDRAERWAPRGRATAEGQAALGMVAMADGRNADAFARFEQAVAQRPDSPRGLLGLGAVLLTEDRPVEAATHLDAAAGIFGDHLGSWIAAGWAWLLAGEPAKARERFDRVVALDDTFSEAHGGLALLDLREGDTEAARRRAEIAVRLDRQSLGGRLVQSLLLAQAGNPDAARRIIDTAMNQPMGPRGETVTQMLAKRAAIGRE
jgi:tetratricopeptide (TPR) repeat protein